MNVSVCLIPSIIFHAASPFEYGKFDYPGSCPTVRYIKDLDFNRVIGWWYRCFSTLYSSSCYHNEGQTVYAYTLNETVSGVAACCRMDESDGQSFNTVVLDADYENFLISYACNSKSVEQIFIYSRSYEECEALESRARSVLIGMIFRGHV